ncbi:hypothetical protein [Agitococcus lubricus]|uniref:Uncharacterized protein n=1 Tax=Agitococcus lubricus TaxID=1077255 RepID=A0A2T5J0S8_9GAMM|nr:hypothetical protein [Agitococcus lubricus]PTQ90002.1 hypothetical protein C8N29_10440 [Agitococcus lubricus]
MSKFKPFNLVASLWCVLGLQLTGCGGGGTTPDVAGVSTGGTGGNISPNLGGGGSLDTTLLLDASQTIGTGVNSATQPPLFGQDQLLTVQPLRIQQSDAKVSILTNDVPPITQYQFNTNLKAEGVLPTVDGAILWFSTPKQTGYQLFSFDAGGSPLLSKNYGLNGKVLAANVQTITSRSYFLNLFLYNEKDAEKISQFIRVKIIDGDITTTNQVNNITHVLVAANMHDNTMLWIDADNQQKQSLNVMQCTTDKLDCQRYPVLSIKGAVLTDNTSPRSAQTTLSVVGNQFFVYSQLDGQKWLSKYAISGANVVLVEQKAVE